jgi:hypothetical protein
MEEYGWRSEAEEALLRTERVFSRLARNGNCVDGVLDARVVLRDTDLESERRSSEEVWDLVCRQRTWGVADSGW